MRFSWAFKTFGSSDSAITAWVVGSAVSAVFVLRGWGLNALAISWSVTQFGTYGACYIRVKARFPAALSGGLSVLTRYEAATRLRKGFWVVVSQMAVMLASGVDLLVIAAVRGPAQVTPYTITDKLVTMLNTIPIMIMASAQPALSELSSSLDRKRLPDVCVALTRIVLLVSGLVASVVLVVDKGFVAWWIGPQEFAGGTLVILLVADMVVSHWTAAMAYTVFSFGYERLISLTSILTGALTVVLTVVLVRHVGLIGAPLAAIVARASVSLPVLLVALARATGGVVRTLLFSVFSWAWRAAFCAALAVAAARLWTPHSPLAIGTAALGAALVYAAVMMPLVLTEPVATYARPRIAALGNRWRVEVEELACDWC